MTPVGERRLSSPRLWRYTTRQMVWAGLDLIFPPHCGGCGQAGQRFCAACRASLSYLLVPVCERCGYPLPPVEADGGRCVPCRRQPDSALTGVRSVAFFEGPLQQAIHCLKYKRDIILADALAGMLREAWQVYNLPGDLVIPVPLSSERLRERGYNQAGWLARGFAELAGLPYAPSGAVRLRHTVSQVGLSARQRRDNVAGAFAGKSNVVAGRSVILVDDVYTTGATLTACAEGLRSAGAARVWGLTLSRPRFNHL